MVAQEPASGERTRPESEFALIEARTGTNVPTIFAPDESRRIYHPPGGLPLSLFVMTDGQETTMHSPQRPFLFPRMMRCSLLLLWSCNNNASDDSVNYVDCDVATGGIEVEVEAVEEFCAGPNCDETYEYCGGRGRCRRAGSWRFMPPTSTRVRS